MHTATLNTSSKHPLRLIAGWLDLLDLAPGAGTLDRQDICLSRGQTLLFRSPKGRGLRCERGCLWITHDDAPDDHIVEAGGHHVAASDGRMLVHAMSDARFTVQDEPAG